MGNMCRLQVSGQVPGHLHLTPHPIPSPAGPAATRPKESLLPQKTSISLSAAACTLAQRTVSTWRSSQCLAEAMQRGALASWSRHSSLQLHSKCLRRRSHDGLGCLDGCVLGDAKLLVQEGPGGGCSKAVHADGLALGAHPPLPAECACSLDRHLPHALSQSEHPKSHCSCQGAMVIRGSPCAVCDGDAGQSAKTPQPLKPMTADTLAWRL